MCLQQVEYQSVVGLPSVERRPPRNTQPLHAYRRVSPPSAGSLIRRVREGDEWGPRIRRTHNSTTDQDRIYIHGFSCWVVWGRMLQCFESQEVTALSDIPLFEDFVYAVGEHQGASWSKTIGRISFLSLHLRCWTYRHVCLYQPSFQESPTTMGAQFAS